jgi:hypothetical protein
MATSRQRIQLRRDTAAHWTAANPVLLAGEAGYETDTGSFKIGNGSSAWNALPYASTTRLQDMSDVLAANKVDGSLLIYDSAAAKFVANDINTKITLTDGGNF